METPRATPLLDERFLLLETLGRGGMGSVYRAFDRAERRLVAVKVAGETGAAGPAHPLAAEFEAWCRLRHPNIIRAYGMGRARDGPLPPGTPYLVLESFSGQPAHQSLRPGRVAAHQVEELAHHVLHALDHVHGAGLVHRDLKPGNILVDTARRGPMRVKLTDFGLAAEAGHAGEPGRVSGSLPYVSPESILGLPLDGRADLYGLGVVLFFLAAGRRPVESRDPRDLLRWHLAGVRPEADADLPGLPDRLARFIVRLMSRSRDDRPSSARDALGVLGARSTRRSHPLRYRVERSHLAALRLAVDAAGDGARRVLHLPRERDAAAALVDHARTLAQIRSLALCHVRGEGRRAGASLGRAVLELLLAQGRRARAAVEEYALHADLPIGLVGDLPVWDRTRAAGTTCASAKDLALASRRVAAFFLGAVTHQALVLVVEKGALADPLVRGVVDRLEKSLRSDPTSQASTGGLLLLLGASPSLPGSARAGTLSGSREGATHEDPDHGSDRVHRVQRRAGAAPGRS